MKTREKELLNYIIENQNVEMQTLLDYFHVSRRTLYYDIESINDEIKKIGVIKRLDGKFIYIGSYQQLPIVINERGFEYSSYQLRSHLIMMKLVLSDLFTLESLAEEMDLSKNTIKQTMDQLRIEVLQDHLYLESKPSFHLVGCEKAIRDAYMMLLLENEFNAYDILDRVSHFNQLYNLQLTDDSLGYLSKMIVFIEKRNKLGFQIERNELYREVCQYEFYNGVHSLLDTKSEREELYLASYIASLSAIGYSQEVDEKIKHCVNALIHEFERHCAIDFDHKDQLIHHMTRHISSSYYRIKYRFPIYNPILEDIKTRHSYLFNLVKRILQNKEVFDVFAEIREDEIGFIAAYFGSYIKRQETQKQINRVVIVCPSGLLISKSLEMQIIRCIPGVNIVGVIPLRELESFNQTYDFIISTIPIEHKDVIVVSPILTKIDKQILVEQLLDIQSDFQFIQVDEVMREIEKFATVHDEKKLRKQLESIMYQHVERERMQPMLKEVLTRSRIQSLEKVSSWQEAIEIAAKPLVDQKAIDSSYVKRMIESIYEHGPYIVLADGFALPHASPGEDVHEVSMSLLVLEQPVDLEGKPVTIFNVLATIDQQAHLMALSALSELLMDDTNMAIFKKGNAEEILKLIQEEEGQ